jgi:hypothetical protein
VLNEENIIYVPRVDLFVRVTLRFQAEIGLHENVLRVAHFLPILFMGTANLTR